METNVPFLVQAFGSFSDRWMSVCWVHAKQTEGVRINVELRGQCGCTRPCTRPFLCEFFPELSEGGGRALTIPSKTWSMSVGYQTIGVVWHELSRFEYQVVEHKEIESRIHRAASSAFWDPAGHWTNLSNSTELEWIWCKQKVWKLKQNTLTVIASHK